MRRILFLLSVVLPGFSSAFAADTDSLPPRVPEWAKSAIWYQIFPERFRNGDPSNDPTRRTLEMHFPNVPGWKASSWTSDFYARDEWEKAIGPDFYENGVFHRRYGGDLQGVIDELDYLKALGVNAIYFNPVFWGRSQHKYDGNTFHHIDPNFGPDPQGDFKIIFEGGETADPATWKWTAADKLFLKLVKEAHARGMHVIIDGVFNHSGRDFFAFRDIRLKGAQSPYVSWYTVTAFDDPETRRNELKYRGWAGFFTLPEFRNSEDGTDLHPGPKKYIFDATRRWMNPDGKGVSEGVDGWRLDVAEELPPKFWRDWNAHVASINPQAFTVAEVWNDAARYLGETGFSATMNYYAFAVPVKGYLIDNSIKPSAFGVMLDERRGQLPAPVQLAMQNLVDSHDTDRVAQMVVNRNLTGHYKNAARFDYDEPGNSARSNEGYLVRKPNAEDRAIQKLVALFQATYVGAPMFFYGTEAGIWGGDDPDSRKPMPWPDTKMDPEKTDPRGRSRPADDSNFDADLQNFFREILALRSANAGFRSPDFKVLVADDAKNIFVFSRGAGADLRVVAINRSNAEQTVRVPAPLKQVLLSTGKEASIKTTGTECELTLPPLTGMVLR